MVPPYHHHTTMYTMKDESLSPSPVDSFGLWFDVQTLVANAFHNWRGSRSYQSIHMERSRGFTETWGASSSTSANETKLRDRPVLGWVPTEESASKTINVPHVVQFRPAWAVQLALRAAHIDHVVVNASYAVAEATGPLPLLRDEKALVGSTRHILQYLKETQQIQLARTSSTTEASLAADALLQDVIAETLANVLVVLRYRDAHSWKATERNKSFKAVHGNWFMGQWHVWAERQAALAALGKIRTVPQAKIKAKQAYAYLEEALQKSPELFLDKHFSMAGLLLFEHVMFALADSHLVTLLHHYPNLCRYGQTVWETYFADTSKFAKSLEKNQKVNATNPFFLLPTVETEAPLPVFSQKDRPLPAWHTRLVAVGRQAANNKPRRTVPTEPAPAPPTESTADAAVAAYQTADQQWLATVLLVAVVAVSTLFQSAREESP